VKASTMADQAEQTYQLKSAINSRRPEELALEQIAEGVWRVLLQRYGVLLQATNRCWSTTEAMCIAKALAEECDLLHPLPRGGLKANEIFYVSFNQDSSCFVCGTETGFHVYSTDPFRSSGLGYTQSSSNMHSNMQVFVRALTGRTLTLKVDSMDTIDAVKLLIEDRTGIPPTCFYLTYAGKNLADSRLVSDYNVSRDCTLTMLMRLYSMRLDSVSGGERCDQEPMTKRRRALT